MRGARERAGQKNKSASSRTAKLPRARLRPQRGRIGRGRLPGARGRRWRCPSVPAALPCRFLAAPHRGRLSPPPGLAAGSCSLRPSPAAEAPQGSRAALPSPPGAAAAPRRRARSPCVSFEQFYNNTNICVGWGEGFFFFSPSSLPTRSAMVAGHARTPDPHTHTRSDLLPPPNPPSLKILAETIFPCRN